jgi:hypothetical protein
VSVWEEWLRRADLLFEGDKDLLDGRDAALSDFQDRL